MALLVETEEMIFNNLLFFEREVARPQTIKREIDMLMPRLHKIGVQHKNIVISRVIKNNHVKKTMLMQIHMPIDVNASLLEFIDENPRYSLENNFSIGKGLKLVISNNEDEFRDGINQLMKRRPDFDMSKNPIVEMSHISYDGTVMSFELFLEDKILL